MKLFFALILIFSGTAAGLHFAQKLVRRKNILRDFSAMLSRASIQIEYNASDVYEIFSENSVGFGFSRAEAFADQWYRYVGTFSSDLKQEDMELLRAFATGLGMTDIPSQQKHISLYQKLIDEHADAAQEDIEKKAKLYRVAPFSLSVIIALLFL